MLYYWNRVTGNLVQPAWMVVTVAAVLVQLDQNGGCDCEERM